MNRIFAILIFLLFPSSLFADPNFYVPNHPDLEQKAESLLVTLNEFWFADHPPIRLRERLKIDVEFARHSSGATSFDGSGNPFRMIVRGSKQQIENAVLPHEVNHVVLHNYWHETIPRWIDEGLCVGIEGQEGKKNPYLYLRQKPLNSWFSYEQLTNMREYPQDVGLFYGQSYICAMYCCRKFGHRYTAQNVRNLRFDMDDVKQWYTDGFPVTVKSEDLVSVKSEEMIWNPESGQWECPRGIIPRLLGPSPTPVQPLPAPIQQNTSGLQAQIDQLKQDRDIGIQQLQNLNTVVQENSKLLNNNSAAVGTLQDDLNRLRNTSEEHKGLLGKILEKLGSPIEGVKNKIIDDSVSNLIIWLAGIIGLSTPATVGLVVAGKIVKHRIEKRNPKKPESADKEPVKTESGIKEDASAIKQKLAFPEIPRNNEEAVQLLQLRAKEGRDVVHDAFIGMSLEDILEDYQDDTPISKTDLLTKLKIKFNRIFPFPGD